MQQNIKYCAILLTLGCSACASDPIPVPVVIPPAPVSVPQITPMTLNRITWKVYNVSDLKALVAKMEASGDKSTVLFSLDANGYNALSMNMIEIKRFIKDQSAVTQFLIGVLNEQQKQATPPQKDNDSK